MAKPSDFISNEDLERFTKFLNPRFRDFIFYEADITEPHHLDEIFHDGNYFAIIFRENPQSNVGHWVLFVKHSPTRYEYFDCLGLSIPENIYRVLEQRAEQDGDISLDRLTLPLMASNNNECGKYVMLRINSLPTPLKDFAKFFEDISKKYSPDVFIKLFYNLPL